MPHPGQGNLNVVLENRGSLILRSGDYVATGGEGTIYQAHDTIVKIYHDPLRARRDCMQDKLKLLSRLNHNFIVVPQGLVFDQKKQFIGFYMPHAKGEALPRVFTTSFWRREGFNDSLAKMLVARMRETMQFAHDQGAIMADPNELNWQAIIKGANGPEPRILDVDSWAVGRWPARAVMLSVRDWHTKSFNEMTDWFSWGVVTFQVFTGIHPYKGTLAGFQPGELEARMKANASVFLPGVMLNQAVRDFKRIPGPLLDWYKSEFQDGKRSMPPSPYDTGVSQAAAAQVMRAVATARGLLVFDLLLSFAGDEAIRVWPCGVVMLASGDLFDLLSKRKIGRLESRDGEVVRVDDGWLIADWRSGNPNFTFVDDRSFASQPTSWNLRGYRFFRYEERLFLACSEELVEIQFIKMTMPIVSVKRRIPVLQPKAVKWFDGVGIQNALGAVFLIAPFGENSCALVRTRELDNLVPIMAKAGGRFVTIIAADKNGNYEKFEFSFNRDYTVYGLWRAKTDSPEINIAILPKGVCATIIRDTELDIFVPGNPQINKISDQKISTDMVLANWGDKVVYIQNGQVWAVRMT